MSGGPSTKRVICLLGLVVVVILLNNLHAILDAELLSFPGRSYTLNDAPIISEDAVPNRLFHRAEFGLGHRLLRASTAWHLAQKLGFAKIIFQWNKCGNDEDRKDSSIIKSEVPIFEFLFGKSEWSLPSYPTNLQLGKNVLVRNDVTGYLPTQTFLDHRIPLNDTLHKGPAGPFLSKIASDIAFYRQLYDRFLHKDMVDEFMAQHKFQDHRVIGLHVRAGNGERQHFSQAGRGIANETEFVSNLVELIANHLLLGAEKSLPPLLFLATDTPYLVPIISNLTESRNIRTVVFPQLRMADNQGVTFSALAGTGLKCLLAWQAMVVDMMLLANSDILIAARHSSFTQSMPLSLVLARKQSQYGPHFCEVSAAATAMSCYQDSPAWLFRDDPNREWNFQLPHFKEAETNIPVRHKSMIHLPEENWTALPDFQQLMSSLVGRRRQDEQEWITFGRKFNPRFRDQKVSDKPGWNFK